MSHVPIYWDQINGIGGLFSTPLPPTGGMVQVNSRNLWQDLGPKTPSVAQDLHPDTKVTVETGLPKAAPGTSGTLEVPKHSPTVFFSLFSFFSFFFFKFNCQSLILVTQPFGLVFGHHNCHSLGLDHLGLDHVLSCSKPTF